jgi:hypothetical protein
MRVAVKTLGGDTITVEVDENETVAALKVALAKQREDWRSALALQLTCNNKLLVDSEPLSGAVTSHLSASPEHFLVLVVKARPPTLTPAGAAKAAEIMTEHAASAASMLSMQAMLVPGVSATVPSTVHEVYDEAIARFKRDAMSGGSPATSKNATVPSPPPASAKDGSKPSLSFLAACALRAADAAALAAVTPQHAPVEPGAASNAAFQRLGSGARAAAISRGLSLGSPPMRKLLSMPEVQALLQMTTLEGIMERPADLQRVLKATMLQPEFQRAVKAGTVSAPMLETVLRGGLVEPRPSEAFVTLAEEARTFAAQS